MIKKEEEFLKILTENKKKAEDQKINWESNKKNWLKDIEQFFKKVEEFLEKYKENDLIKIKYEPFYITEEYLGNYQTEQMIMTTADNMIAKFIPKGRNVIGAAGRIDLEGKNGTVRFVLVDKSSKMPMIKTQILAGNKKTVNYDINPTEVVVKKELVWKIATPPPNIQYIEFNKENFINSLMEVMNA